MFSFLLYSIDGYTQMLLGEDGLENEIMAANGRNTLPVIEPAHMTDLFRRCKETKAMHEEMFHHFGTNPE